MLSFSFQSGDLQAHIESSVYKGFMRSGGLSVVLLTGVFFISYFLMLILENTACTFASHRKQNLRINTTELVLSAEYNGRTARCNTKATGLRVSTFPRVELDLLIFLFFGCFSPLEKFSFLCCLHQFPVVI